MESSRIIAILNYPDAAMVEHILSRANLTAQERQILMLREFEGHTIESAAEALMISDTTVKRRYSAAMTKLNACWSNIPWLQTLPSLSKYKQ